VNNGTTRRLQNLEEVLQELRTQIELILQDPDHGVH
jgi:hypothetical protein